jgi:hypothetical protein
MGPEYERYYNERLAQLVSSSRVAAVSPFYSDVALAVERGIEQAALPQPYQVRPDAKLFLVINFEELVVLPTRTVESSAASDPLPDLVNAEIPEDVAIIVNGALRRAAAEGDTDITAHDLMQVIAANWEQLGFAQPWRWER